MSIVFNATNPFGDPSLDHFTWSGNAEFLKHLPHDPLISTFITPDYQNTAVELTYARMIDGKEHDVVVWLTFAPNGRWIEDTKVYSGKLGDLFGAAILFSDEFAWEGPRVGLKHFRPPHLPPEQQVLAEGPWAPHHQALAMHYADLFA